MIKSQAATEARWTVFLNKNWIKLYRLRYIIILVNSWLGLSLFHLLFSPISQPLQWTADFVVTSACLPASRTFVYARLQDEAGTRRCLVNAASRDMSCRHRRRNVTSTLHVISSTAGQRCTDSCDLDSGHVVEKRVIRLSFCGARKNNKKAQLTLSNPRDVKACQNCSNSTCFVSFHRIPFPQIANA